VLTNRTVESHVTSIIDKLGLSESTENRRVVAVLTWLGLRANHIPTKRMTPLSEGANPHRSGDQVTTG
jgi:hypothetical protein